VTERPRTLYMPRKVFPWGAVRVEREDLPLTAGPEGSFGVVLAFRTREEAEAFAPGIPVDVWAAEYPAAPGRDTLSKESPE
jgi:hypothetical protein